MIRRTERERMGRMVPGEELVVAGYIGETGAAAIARAREKELLAWFTRDYIRAIQEEDRLAAELSRRDWEALGATEYEMTGEGGIFTALWALSATYQKGISVELPSIPVRQKTIELCERYELNPYRLWSGCALLVADNGGRLVRQLKKMGINGAVIGCVLPGATKEICCRGETGCLERPRPDEVYRILPGFVIEEGGETDEREYFSGN